MPKLSKTYLSYFYAAVLYTVHCTVQCTVLYDCNSLVSVCSTGVRGARDNQQDEREGLLRLEFVACVLELFSHNRFAVPSRH